MSYDSIAFRTAVLVSFQQALVDMVTPPLRAVSVTPTGPLIRALFVYESVSEKELMLMLEVEAHVAADFHSPVDVDFRALEPPPERRLSLSPGDAWIFRRHEGLPD